ncbi:MAG: diguanylate cyclase domain-containing protein [Pseudomonadota bacterium]
MAVARLLIVEDHLIVASDMADVLVEHGHEVCGIAADGPTAIRMAAAARPDLALVDVTLAHGTDGIATAGELARRFGTPVVFVTGQGHMVPRVACGIAVLEKPVSADDLAAAVDIALAWAIGDRPVRPPHARLHRLTPSSPKLPLPAEGEARFRAVFEHAPHGLAIVDLDRRIIDANHALAQIVGSPADILAGAVVDDLPFMDIAAARALRACVVGDRDEIPTVEIEATCLDGCSRAMLTNGRLVRDEAEHPRFVVLHIQNVTQMRRLEAELRRLACSDPLTALPNRTAFLARLQEARARHDRGLATVALMLMDLDHFKQINDAHGHLAGDAVLCAVADRLAERLRATDFAARLGGDEFAAIIETSDESGVVVVARDILERIQRPVRYQQHVLEPKVSVGIALCRANDTENNDLIRRADAALYEAKTRSSGAIEPAAIGPPVSPPDVAPAASEAALDELTRSISNDEHRECR